MEAVLASSAFRVSPQTQVQVAAESPRSTRSSQTGCVSDIPSTRGALTAASDSRPRRGCWTEYSATRTKRLRATSSAGSWDPHQTWHRRCQRW